MLDAPIIAHRADADAYAAGRFLGVMRRRPANPPFHQDKVANLASLDAVLPRDLSVIHVGHGGPLQPSRVRRWADSEHRKLAGRPQE